MKGDKGITTTLSGKKFVKNAPEIEAIGVLDELQAHIFLIISKKPKEKEQFQRIGKNLYKIMSAISREEDLELTEEIMFIEHKIDAFDKISQFKEFNKKELSANINLARAVCRRAERRVLNLKKNPKKILAYLNRLSLFLFYLAVNT
jgi:cob(I)alamin adenosyltransferase